MREVIFEEQSAFHMASRASLLGLPPELRLQIYDYLRFDHKLQLNLKTVRHTPLKRGHQRYLVPWCGLLQAHSVFAHELRSLLKADTADVSCEYVVEIDLSGNTSLDAAVWWTRMPCAPAKVRFLTVNVTVSGANQLHNPKETKRLGIGLFSSLTHFLHCGPSLDEARELEDAIHLKHLTFNVGMLEADQILHYGKRSLTIDTIGRAVDTIARNGALYSLVEHIQFNSIDLCSSIPIEQVLTSPVHIASDWKRLTQWICAQWV